MSEMPTARRQGSGAGAPEGADGARRARSASPFLSFVAAEFARRGTEERRLLSNKLHAHREVEALGVATPKRLAVIDDLATLRPADLQGRCVLKYARGWSSRGVMLLERLEEDVWFDHMAAKPRDFRAILKSQEEAAQSFGSERPQWIIEEMISSTIRGKPIPFDYKFYCFRDRVGLIVQMDRNAQPPQVCLLRPSFAPFVLGTDYVLARTDARPGNAVVPRHAALLRQTARLLSLRTDAPFVSIDLYDSPSGPVFGEFTFSPGGTHRALWSYAPALLAELDRLFTEQSDASLQQFRRRGPDLTRLYTPPPAVYGRLAATASLGNARAIRTLALIHREAAEGATQHDARILTELARAWSVIREGQEAARQAEAAAAARIAAGWDTGQELPSPQASEGDAPPHDARREQDGSRQPS